MKEFGKVQSTVFSSTGPIQLTLLLQNQSVSVILVYNFGIAIFYVLMIIHCSILSGIINLDIS
jgi:hypothetical protein